MDAMTLPVERGEQFANWLAVNLTDLEFELLLRERIKLSIAKVMRTDSNLSESHNEVSFKFNPEDKSEWYVAVGESYGKRESHRGEVLETTALQLAAIYNMRYTNRLSNLLPAPKGD